MVKPKISTLTEHLSKVLDKMSAQIAAIVMGLPLIDPELSINKVTIVKAPGAEVGSLSPDGWHYRPIRSFG